MAKQKNASMAKEKKKEAKELIGARLMAAETSHRTHSDDEYEENEDELESNLSTVRKIKIVVKRRASKIDVRVGRAFERSRTCTRLNGKTSTRL